MQVYTIGNKVYFKTNLTRLRATFHLQPLLRGHMEGKNREHGFSFSFSESKVPKPIGTAKSAALLFFMHATGEEGWGFCVPFRLFSPSRNFRYFSVFICLLRLLPFQLEGGMTTVQIDPKKAYKSTQATPAVLLFPPKFTRSRKRELHFDRSLSW